MNIRLNHRFHSHPKVKQLLVHPACGDSGTAIGAAAFAVNQAGIPIKPRRDLYLGPSFSTDDCLNACMNHRDKPVWEVLPDPFERAAELLANGQIVAWFRGRMEFGPRALGNRSILANPLQTGITDAINQQVKFRSTGGPIPRVSLILRRSSCCQSNFGTSLCVSHTLSAGTGRSSIR